MNKRITAIILVIAMLATAAVSGTMALFTDGERNSGNRVSTGSLDVEMYYADSIGGETVSWTNVETAQTEETAEGEEPVASAPIFSYQNWEPGYTDVKYIKIVNNGDYAFRYGLSIVPTGNVGDLAKAIEVYYIAEPQGDITGRDALGEPVCSLYDLMNKSALAYKSMGVLLPALGENETAEEGRYYGEIVVAVALRMDIDAGNEYQGASVGDSFALELYATQYTYEEDDFGSDYDAAATFPNLDIWPMTITVPVETAEDGTLAEAVEIRGLMNVGAYVPAGVKLAVGVEELSLTISLLEKTTGNVTPGEGEEMRSFDVHIEGVAADNTTPILVDMGAVLPIYMNQGNVAIYHVENDETKAMTEVDSLDELDAHNEFYYDLNTGELTVAMATFSEVLTKIDTDKKWEGSIADDFNGGSGTESDPYIIVNADQLAYMNELISAGEKTDAHYKLISDINFGGSDYSSIWYPIGYWAKGEGTNNAGETWYTKGGEFSGTFDGAGHTITGIYQNTWAMDGNYDNGYWKAAMGLFGYVNGGTVKNLTIDNFYSEGEFAPTGCVTAYAAGNATFENIAITNSHPQTYNTGVAGIVGWDEGDDSNFTFKNITVDSSNTISALWGSWDVAAAGLLGYLGEYSKANLTNCNVSATIDVYNDVCGNYQYYWYRYCGMLIGTVDKTNEDGSLDLSNITATNCTVNFDDRHEYYYCEDVDNSIASYTHDYQFSRISHSDLNFDDSNGNGRVDTSEVTSVTSCKHDHKAAGYEEKDIDGDGVIDNDVLKENNQAVYIPFRQIFGGYGWGVDGVEMEEYNLGITDTTKQISKGDEKSVVKFASAFPTLNSGLSYVGNRNEIAISKLFEIAEDVEADDINDSGVYVTITSLYEELEVAGTFTPNTTDWTKGTVQFDKTGPVKVTIQDYDYCTPTVLYLEVVDALNVTSATDATANNVVLLNDISGGFTVSNGHTVYGNGFTATCSGNGSYSSKTLTLGFVEVSAGGVLDNVQVICDIFPESYLYTTDVTADSQGKYPYVKSAVIVKGNSTISNCYIYGARNNIYVGEGNVTIKNTTTECGSLSNIQIKSVNGYTVTLDDVTTIQYKTSSDFDTSKTVLGFGVLVNDNESTSNPTIKLTGDFVQYNWMTDADTSVSNSYAKTAIESALKVDAYQHTDSSDNTTVNAGIAYLNSLDAPIVDERSNDSIEYKLSNISMSGYSGQVYSIVKGTGTPVYKDNTNKYDPTTNTEIMPTVSFMEEEDALTFESGYNAIEGRWISTLTVDLDSIEGGSYAFSFDDLKVQKYGVDLEFTVKDSAGNAVDKNTTITLNQLYNAEYTLVAEDNIIFDEDGNLILDLNKVEMRELPFIITATKTSIPDPTLTYDAKTFTSAENGRLRLADSQSGDWRPTVNALAGVTITYWDTGTNSEVALDLGNLDLSTNKGTVSNNVWTYTCDDFTLSLTGGEIKTGYNITPIVSAAVDGTAKLFYCSTNVAYGTTSTNDNRTIKIDYVLTANNKTATLNRNETVNFSDLTVYDYNKFKEGILEEAGSGGGCVTPETLITLADGSQKEIQYVTYADQLLVWDFFNGEYAAVPASVIVFHGDADYEVLTLKFSDGTEVRTIGAHDFFDIEENEFVSIDAANVPSYVGHHYVKADGDSYTTVELVDYEVVTEYTGSYSLLSAYHNNFIAEGMFSLTPLMAIDTDNFCEWFEVGEGMKYDEEAMQADIEKYGLYTFEDFEDYLTYEQYVALNAPYYKVLVGKGEITFEELLTAISLYVD